MGHSGYCVGSLFERIVVDRSQARILACKRLGQEDWYGSSTV